MGRHLPGVLDQHGRSARLVVRVQQARGHGHARGEAGLQLGGVQRVIQRLGPHLRFGAGLQAGRQGGEQGGAGALGHQRRHDPALLRALHQLQGPGPVGVL